MPRVHIAGFDGSEAATAAVRFARRLATAPEDEVIAATVHRTVPYALAPGPSAGADAALVEEIRRDAVDLLDTLAVEGVRKEVVAADSPAQGLHRLAEEEGAHLVAVGVTHRSAIGRLMIGGVGDKLLHGAPCPVAVVPAGWEPAEIRRIGVAFDVRDESAAAVKEAEALALRLNAQLVVIGVYEAAAYLWLTSPAPAPHPWDRSELREAFDADLQRVVDGLDPAVQAQPRTLSGLPGPTLVEASGQGLDLLVMGSRGYGPIGSVLLGSVSRYVADHAVSPVLVIPRTAR